MAKGPLSFGLGIWGRDIEVEAGGVGYCEGLFRKNTV
jgi:hypothetical protein